MSSLYLQSPTHTHTCRNCYIHILNIAYITIIIQPDQVNFYVLSAKYCSSPNKIKNENKKEGRKEMFYLTMHSTHFIYGYIVKDHSDNERGSLLPPHGLLFPISSKGSFICTIPDRISHTMDFVTPVVEHWL